MLLCGSDVGDDLVVVGGGGDRVVGWGSNRGDGIVVVVSVGSRFKNQQYSILLKKRY